MSYFNEMITLISFECIMAQTRMGFGRVTLPSKDPMMGPMCLRYGEILVCLFVCFFFIDFLFSFSASFCLKCLCLFD